MSQHLSTCIISSKSKHAFLSNLASRQTDKCGQMHLSPLLSEVTREQALKLKEWKNEANSLLPGL